MTERSQPPRKSQSTRRAHDAVRRSTCGNCPCGCGVKVFLKQGKLVDIFGDEEHPANKGSFCPKGLLEHYHLENSQRITTPQLRDDLSKPFRRASWAEAIAFVADRLGAVRQAGGSVAVHAQPGSSFGHLLGGTRLAAAMGSPMGPWRFLPHRGSAGGALSHMLGIGAQHLLMNTPRDWCNSRAILVLGCDPAATDPMTMLPIVDARDRGTSVITIDTRTTMTALKSSYALRPRPGTLGIALRGIVNILIASGQSDAEFIAEAIDGFDRLREEVTAYPAQLVAEQCAVSVGELEKIARVIGSARPLQVVAGGWLGLEEIGDDELRHAAALVALKGSVGVPGGGLNLLATSPFDPAEWLEPEQRELARGEALTLAQALSGEARPAAWVLEGNPLARLPGGRAVVEALAASRLTVAFAAYASPATALAHVVVPMASWLESDGLLAAGNGRSLQWHGRVLDPPEDCRTPIDFWTDLAQTCGLAGAMPWQAAEVGSRNRAAAQWALARNPLTRALSVEAIDPEHNPPGGVLWPCTDTSQISFEDSRFVRGDVRGRNIQFQRASTYPGSEQRFPTPNGRIQLASDPAREPAAAAQVPDGNTLVLVASPAVDHVEPYTGAISDRPHAPGVITASIHPLTARALGLAHDGSAIIENSLGSLRARVRVSDAVSPGVVWCIVPPGAHDAATATTTPWSLLRIVSRRGVRAQFAEVSVRALDTARRP